MTKQSSDHTDITTDPSQADSAKPAERPKRRWPRILVTVAVVIAIAGLLAGGTVGYLYASTPVTIRQPLLEHYHFRMQVLVNGKAENFATAKYQTGYSKDNCNVLLPDSPIHFHDNQDQMVHIHWEGITGGQVLKYYGWNFIGGTRGSLGYRFDKQPGDEMPTVQKVPIHGENLPAIPSDANFYVYVSDGDSYKEKAFDDFTKQDIEKFFGKISDFPAHKINQEKRKTSLLEIVKSAIVPTAYAHGSEDHSGSGHDEAELKKINNLLGDVLIFAQKDKPSDQQVRDRLDKLVPLTDSTCGG